MSASLPLGILGGTFDPIHRGHLVLAHEAQRQLSLEQVILMPAGFPWQRVPSAPAADRLAMTQLAAITTRGITVDDREVRRATPTYTIDTLIELRAELGHLRPLWLILGADAFLNLPTWKRWQDVLTLAHVAVFNRPSAPSLTTSMPASLKTVFDQHVRLPQQVKTAAGAIALLQMPLLDISSSRVREACKKGLPTADLLPATVLDYIESHQLYR